MSVPKLSQLADKLQDFCDVRTARWVFTDVLPCVKSQADQTLYSYTGSGVGGERVVAVLSFETSATPVTAQTQAQIWHKIMLTSDLETAFSAGQTFNVAETGVGI